MAYDFDTIIDRRASDSAKWHFYSEDVLPMWVADMDFRSPEPILRAMHERIDHGVFGYGGVTAQLREVICERMARLYNWKVHPEAIVSLPGLVSGLNVVSRAIGDRGDGVLVNTPVYPPFLSAPTNQERELQSAPLAKEEKQGLLHYSLDVAALTQALQANTRLFILCNPHNPIGRAYTRAELQQLAEFCLRHDLVICSDEIHCDLLLGSTQHIPLASLDPEIAERTITLMAPSKTFNVPGLGCSLAIIPNAGLRQKLQKASNGIVPHVNLLGYTAAVAAYAECEDWLQELRTYLTANRDLLVETITREMPQLRVTVPEATYLGWIDCRESGIEGNPQKFFLEQAKVALNDGVPFGDGGEGFVRLNFGCPRGLLEQGLASMQRALQGLG
ncbi:MAG: PatB family C-S lyase [Caldilineaceae bacterium]|nr:PatB family C-S lyase [Caldilineaceae bacterium]